MRHHCKRNNLNRAKDQKTALLRSLARELVKYGHIETTLSKAKVLRTYVEKLITKAIKSIKTEEVSQKVHYLRLIRRELAPEILPILVKAAENLKERPGGYTRIIKQGSRRGDNTQMSIIQILDN